MRVIFVLRRGIQWGTEGDLLFFNYHNDARSNKHKRSFVFGKMLQPLKINILWICQDACVKKQNLSYNLVTIHCMICAVNFLSSASSSKNIPYNSTGEMFHTSYIRVQKFVVTLTVVQINIICKCFWSCRMNKITDVNVHIRN